MPLEQEVAIDPEIIGKIFERLLEVDERKDKGAYYTPRHIVQQICQETLITYLFTNTNDIPRSDISNFIKNSHIATDEIIRSQEEFDETKIISIPNTILDNLNILDLLLSEVKVVDPAVGSGAFPVEMLGEIVQAKSIIKLLKGHTDINFYELKREVIENSLYAVDISYAAADITKLRFWLALIVDEKSIKDVRPLPNLDNKVMVGNSLIDQFEGIKLFDKSLIKGALNKQTTLLDKKSSTTLKLLDRKKKAYFNEHSKNKKNIKYEIQNLKWQFIEETIKENTNYKNKKEILNSISKYKHTESKPFFIWELEFSEIFQTEKPGFDIVIGNPPYVRQEKIKEIKPLLKKIYKTYDGKADLYVYFFEKGINLLKNNGCLSYITSNKYAKAGYGKNLRKFLLNYFIELYIDYTDNPIFEDATVDTSIIQFINLKKINKNMFINNEFYMDEKYLNSDSFDFIESDLSNIKNKILNQGTLIKDMKLLKIKIGIETGYNKGFILDKETRNQLIKKDQKNSEIIKPILQGKNIKKWKYTFKDEYVIFSNKGININNYPIIKQYLLQFKKILISKNRKRKWYEIKANNETYKKFEEPKLIFPDISSQGLFAVYDDNNFYAINNCIILSYDNKDDLKIISALFSSNVLNFLLRIIGGKLGSKGLRLRKLYLERLPLKFPSDEETSRIVSLVDKLQEITNSLDDLSKEEKEDKILEIAYLENELNNIIYELYDLNEDDITIIEEYLDSF